MTEDPTPNPIIDPLAPLKNNRMTDANSTTNQAHFHRGIHNPLMANSPDMAAYRPTPVLRIRPDVRSNQGASWQSRIRAGLRNVSEKFKYMVAIEINVATASIAKNQVTLISRRA